VERPKVTILGSTGMLGSITLDFFARESNFELVATHRDADAASWLQDAYPGVNLRHLDAETGDVGQIVDALDGARWAINAIGVIKPYIHDDNPAEVERATRVNGLFPYLLSKAAEQTGSRLIQIATDCVFSGARGAYVETDPHDARDVYGKTKSLGEANSRNMTHLRCSIIGPELRSKLSLLEWFRGQPEGATVNGFSNHRWNGVTTLHFAKICKAIIDGGVGVGRVQHVVPGDTVNKADLLKTFAREFDRTDVTIKVVDAATMSDRTLGTTDEGANRELWDAAGYERPPGIEEMVAEISSYAFSAPETTGDLQRG
jgi:dTDP-4-dehydrorhamnose reductase